MVLAHIRMLIHELLNKDPDIFPEEDPMIIYDSKSYMFMTNNYKETKHTKHIPMRVNVVSNG